MRIRPAGVELDGAGPALSFAVAFIGLSGAGPMRAVSFLGLIAPVRFSTGAALAIGFGFGAAPDGTAAGAAGNGAGDCAAAGGGRGGFQPDDSAGSLSLGGRTAPVEFGTSGRLIGGSGGRFAPVPAAGGKGCGATNGGGGRRTCGVAGVIESGPFLDKAPGSEGGREGKLIRTVSFSTGTVGRWVVRGGRVMRTVSFFGSFKSAITLPG